MTNIRKGTNIIKSGKKKIKRLEISDEILELKSKKKTLKKKPGEIKNSKPAKKKIEDPLPDENIEFESEEKSGKDNTQIVAAPQPEKLNEPDVVRKLQDPIIATNRFFYIAPRTNYFMILFFIIIAIFLFAGYFLPSTQEDIADNKVIWTNNGEYNRGLFDQLFTSIAFALGVFVLGFYISSTFIKLNMRNWEFFAGSIMIMFIFSLGKIGELVYNNTIFDVFKDFVLSIALIMLAYASYKIHADMNGVI